MLEISCWHLCQPYYAAAALDSLLTLCCELPADESPFLILLETCMFAIGAIRGLN